MRRDTPTCHASQPTHQHGDTHTHIMQGSIAKSALTKAVDGIAKYIGGLTKWTVNLDLVFNNTITAHTTYKRNHMTRTITGVISLPIVDDDTPVSDSLYAKLVGYLAHEILHPLLTDFGIFQRAAKTGWGDMLNCAEDVCCEAHNMRQNWQAGGVMYLADCMHDLMTQAFDGGYIANDDRPSQVAWTIKALGYVDVVKYPKLRQHRSRLITALKLNPVLLGQIEQVMEGLDTLVDKYADDAVSRPAERTQEVLDLLQRVFPQTPMGDPDMPPPPPAQPADDEGDDTQPADDTDGDDTQPADDTDGDDTQPADDTDGDDTDGDDTDGDGVTTTPTHTEPKRPKMTDIIEKELGDLADKADDLTEAAGMTPSKVREMLRRLVILK